MKICPTCREEFSEQFKFCPVDSTPLSNGAEASVVGTAAVTAPRAHFQPDGGASAVITEATVSPQAHPNGNGSSAASAGAAREREEYHLTFLQDEGLTRRLLRELKEVGHEAELSWPEFKRDPVGFFKRGVAAYGTAFLRFLSQPNIAKGILGAFVGLLLIAAAILMFDSLQSHRLVSMKAIIIGAAGLVFAGASLALVDRMRAKHNTAVAGIVVAMVLVLTGAGLYILFENFRLGRSAQVAVREDLEYKGMITEDVPQEQPTPDKGPAGMNKGTGGGSKPKFEKPAGGGGGGRNETKPASAGKLPVASLDVPQVRAPDPHPPTVVNPHLPVPATIKADPVLFPPDPRNIPYGDPKSKSTETSSGPGTGGGIGTGTGGGVGPGEGGGVGPGRGGNTGGGDFKVGGGGPGGGGGGGDPDKVFRPTEVTHKAQILARPEPTYTEEARKNQVTGTVRVRMVFNANGSVTNVSAVSRLPDGLTEKAIEAAHKIKFVPAEKDGRKVSQWVTIDYNFNIY